jgi:transposase
MVWDGAGFHTSKALVVPENVTLVKLPAYSPELNPIENLWHYLKSHFWSNRAYDNYQALETAAMDAWKKAVLDVELVKTVCAAPHLDRATSD